jgi:phage tail protein X
MKRRIVTGADGTPVYITIDGDMVDAVAFDFYGQHSKNAEAVFEANPGLAARGAALPAGIAIRLPRLSQQEQPRAFVTLWD